MYGVKPNGAKLAREDFAFLFKAFESGQTPPHRLKKDQEHVPTIHQYLDWTVTGTPSSVRALAPMNIASAQLSARLQ